MRGFPEVTASSQIKLFICMQGRALAYMSRKKSRTSERELHLAIYKQIEVIHAYGLVVVNPELDLLEAF